MIASHPRALRAPQTAGHDASPTGTCALRGVPTPAHPRLARQPCQSGASPPHPPRHLSRDIGAVWRHEGDRCGSRGGQHPPAPAPKAGGWLRASRPPTASAASENGAGRDTGERKRKTRTPRALPRGYPPASWPVAVQRRRRTGGAAGSSYHGLDDQRPAAGDVSTPAPPRHKITRQPRRSGRHDPPRRRGPFRPHSALRRGLTATYASRTGEGCGSLGWCVAGRAPTSASFIV